MKILLKTVTLCAIFAALTCSSFADHKAPAKVATPTPAKASTSTPDLKTAQASMSARLKQIVEYKKAGKIGENHLGYLVVKILGDKKIEELVKAENADRKIVYELIAKKVNSSSEIVGKQRAEQISEKAKEGEWFKDDKGNWSKKAPTPTPAPAQTQKKK